MSGLWAAALAFYLTTHLHPDVSWYLVATGRILDGARPYRDIIEVNPPLAFYLTMPPVLAARLSHLSASACFIVYLFLLIAASVLLADRVLSQSRMASPLYRRAMPVTVFFALSILPMPVFGEREHLMAVLVLPYLFLVSLRSRDEQCSRGIAALVGMIASLGFGLKPYFLIVPALLELYLMIRRRRIAGLGRPEVIMLGIGLALYGVSVPWLTPEYLDVIVPYGRLVYFAYAASLWDAVTEPFVLFLGFPIMVYVLARSSVIVDRTADTFAVAAAGFFASYLIQSKGWDYHLLPTSVAAWLATTSLLLVTLEDRSERAARRRKPLLAWATGALATLASWPLAQGPVSNPFADQAKPIVERYAAGGAIYAFTSHVWVGFPLVNDTGVQWASRFPTQWLLPGALRRLRERPAPDAGTERKLREIESYAVDAVVEDLERTPPAIVFVDKANPYFGESAFDYLGYFNRYPRFRQLWRAYVKIDELVISNGTYSRSFDIWCRRDQSHRCSG